MRNALLAAELTIAAILTVSLLWIRPGAIQRRGNFDDLLVANTQLLPTALPASLPNGKPLPGPTNTGPTNPNILTPSGNLTISTPGAIVQNLAITGCLEIKAPQVTVTNCTVNANGNPCAIQIDEGADNCTVQDTSVTGTGPGQFAVYTNADKGNQFLRLNIYNTASQPFRLDGSSIVNGCWLHQIGWNAAGIKSNPSRPAFTGKDHVDDLFIERGASFSFINNNFDTPDYVTINGVQYGTSAIFFFDPFTAGDVISNVTISNNYLDGGGYVFNMFGQGPYTITNNIIGPHEEYRGYIYPQFIGGPWYWKGNVTQNGIPIFAPRGLKVPPSTQPFAAR